MYQIHATVDNNRGQNNIKNNIEGVIKLTYTCKQLKPNMG